MIEHICAEEFVKLNIGDVLEKQIVCKHYMLNYIVHLCVISVSYCYVNILLYIKSATRNKVMENLYGL